MDRNICTHEPPERLEIPLGKTGWVTDIQKEKIAFGEIVHDYFCNVCNAYVGYFSRIIWRKRQNLREVKE